MTVLNSQHHLFDVPADICYLNAAANSPQLKESTLLLHQGVDFKTTPWKRKTSDFFDNADIVRGLAADIFGGKADNYAIMPSTSYGTATVARIIEQQIQPQQQIIIVENEFPSNRIVWQRLAQERGAELIIAKKAKNQAWQEAIISQISLQTKLLALSCSYWTNGDQVELDEIANVCHANDIILSLDMTQSLGAMPFELEKIKPDFFVAAGYKWLLCPYGFSLFYIDEKWFDSRPLEETWVAQSNSNNYQSAGNGGGSICYRAGARRFDVGQTCVPTILPGVIAAFEQIKHWGVENISETLKSVNEKLLSILLAKGFSNDNLVCPSPHFFGVRPPQNSEVDWQSYLTEQNVFASVRDGYLRISPYLHITQAQVARFQEIINNLPSE